MFPHQFTAKKRAFKLKQLPDTAWEKDLWDCRYQCVAGLDEAGRGSWAGPVVAAAVIFKPYSQISGVDDSKKLTPQKREILYQLICREALSFAVVAIPSEKIDALNILQASLLAMREAVIKLPVSPDYLLVDGNQKPGIDIPQKLLVGGDGLSVSIASASILAKVTRDRLMAQLEAVYPNYRFSRHKGYGTKEHRWEITQHGVTNIHRRSFEPMKSLFCL